MKELTATKVHETSNQRFYKLNRKLLKGKTAFGSDVNIIENMIDPKLNRVKEEYQKDIPKDGCDLICISDATTHIERLVFVGIFFNDGYGRLSTVIGGTNTFMIHGGDSRYVKPDEVYIRILAKLNGYEYKTRINEES